MLLSLLEAAAVLRGPTRGAFAFGEAVDAAAGVGALQFRVHDLALRKRIDGNHCKQENQEPHGSSHARYTLSGPIATEGEIGRAHV